LDGLDTWQEISMLSPSVGLNDRLLTGIPVISNDFSGLADELLSSAAWAGFKKQSFNLSVVLFVPS
jgi:hypothetical protein